MPEELRQQELAYVYSELGVTSSGDKLLYMYGSHEAMDYPAALVYEDTFELLPQHVRELVDSMSANEDVKNPTKTEASNRGKLATLSTPITVMVGKGKKIDWQSVQAGPASQQAKPAAGGRLVEAYVWEPMTPEQAERASLLAKDIVEQQWMIANEVVRSFGERRGEEGSLVVHTSLIEPVHRSATYQFSREWPDVRQALVKPADDALSGTLDSLVIAIEAAEEDEFLDTLAKHHPLLIDAEFAKIILKAVGESGIKKDVEGRVLQAKKAALYIELTNRHEVSADVAKVLVEQVHDQIPF
jgi:hypothetical protein